MSYKRVRLFIVGIVGLALIASGAPVAQAAPQAGPDPDPVTIAASLADAVTIGDNPFTGMDIVTDSVVLSDDSYVDQDGFSSTISFDMENDRGKVPVTMTVKAEKYTGNPDDFVPTRTATVDADQHARAQFTSLMDQETYDSYMAKAEGDLPHAPDINVNVVWLVLVALDFGLLMMPFFPLELSWMMLATGLEFVEPLLVAVNMAMILDPLVWAMICMIYALAGGGFVGADPGFTETVTAAAIGQALFMRLLAQATAARFSVWTLPLFLALEIGGNELSNINSQDAVQAHMCGMAAPVINPPAVPASAPTVPGPGLGKVTMTWPDTYSGVSCLLDSADPAKHWADAFAVDSGEPLYVTQGDHDLACRARTARNSMAEFVWKVKAGADQTIALGTSYAGVISADGPWADGPVQAGAPGTISVTDLKDNNGNPVSDYHAACSDDAAAGCVPTTDARPVKGTITFTDVNDPTHVLTADVSGQSVAALNFTWPSTAGDYRIKVDLIEDGPVVSTPPGPEPKPNPNPGPEPKPNPDPGQEPQSGHDNATNPGSNTPTANQPRVAAGGSAEPASPLSVLLVLVFLASGAAGIGLIRRSVVRGLRVERIGGS